MSDALAQVLDGIKGVQTKLEAELNENIKRYEDEVKTAGVASNEAKSAVAALTTRFEDFQREIDQKSNGYKGGSEIIMTAGQQLTSSEDFKNLMLGRSQNARVEVKNTSLSVVGTTVYPQNVAGVVPGPFKPLTIRDVLPSGQTNAISVVGTREKSYANKAAGVAQGGAKPESDIVFEQFQTPIETVATWLKVSNQLLADAPTVVSYIDTRLRYMLNEVIDAQLLNGTGAAPQLKGLTTTATAYTAVKGDLLVDAINRAKYQLWSLGYAPDTVIVNPADWSAMELSKSTQGQYLYGLPGVPGSMNPFGVQVVLSNNMAAGKFMVANFNRACMLWDRQSVVVEAGYVNTDFTSNLVTLRAETRLGLETSVPAAMLYGAFTATAAA